MVSFFSRIKKQGFSRTIEKGLEKIKYLRKKGIFEHIYQNLIIKLPSFLTVYKSPTPEENYQIEKSFSDNGFAVSNIFIKQKEFEEFTNMFDFGNDFYDGHGNLVWTEKVLEHFLAWEMVIKNLRKDEKYIDIAASNSPWVKLLNEKAIKAVGIDLNESYKFKENPNYLVMDATKTDFEDGSVAGASLQCAFEMFTGEDDINLIKELGRILKVGGKVLVVPLYMHTHHCGYTTKDFRFSRKYHDIGAELYIRNDCTGIPFSRKYDVETLKKRVLETADMHGLDYKIYVLRNGKKIHEGVYCHFVLEFIKRNA